MGLNTSKILDLSRLGSRRIELVLSLTCSQLTYMKDDLQYKTAMDKTFQMNLMIFRHDYYKCKNSLKNHCENQQATQIQKKLYARTKPDSIPVSRITNPLFIPPPHKQQPHFLHTPSKMEVLCFDGSERLGWIFKINSVFSFHHIQKINDYQLHLSTCMAQP